MADRLEDCRHKVFQHGFKTEAHHFMRELGWLAKDKQKLAQSPAPRAFGRGALPTLEPTKRHRDYAKAHNLDLSAVMAELAEQNAVETWGLGRAKEMIGERLSMAARKQAS